ncbi:MAG: elongation factor G, partial [Clostridiaceae bacterium]|nr:elongation factor G [Clostridiaceae bacterium]
LGNTTKSFKYNLEPSLISKVIYPEDVNVKDVLKIFMILDEEDSCLKVVWNEELKEIHIHIMGKIQLEVLKEVLKERFALNVEFGPCKILYKETIANTVIGSGHFEPLRHYAEAHLYMEPGERNSGITFESKCHVDDLSIGYQNLIKTHVFEKEHKGILTGYPITDIKITLINGRSHLKHTSGGDFREATYRAIRQGLEQAENILLEPYYRFKIKVSNEYLGRVLSDISKLYGTFEDPIMEEDYVIIEGRGPVRTFMDYSSSLIAFTKGRGIISLIGDGYDVCHNTEEVIEEIAYDKKQDRENSSISVFCSKGQGYIVEWDKVKDHIHCEIEN